MSKSSTKKTVLSREHKEALDALVSSGRCSQKELEEFKESELTLLAKATLEYLDKGESLTIRDIQMADRRFEVPDIVSFVDDPKWLGNELGFLRDERGRIISEHRQIYDFWLGELQKIYAPGAAFSEVLITGAIGIGKTTIMNVIQAYDYVNLESLANPQRHYSLMPSTRIVFAFFSVLMDQANNVGFAQFNDMLEGSPAFNRLMHYNNRAQYGRRWQPSPDRRIAFQVGSRVSHTLGIAVFASVIDEANFGTEVHDKKADEKRSQVYRNYTQLLRRKESRFMHAPGHFCIGSSKRSTADFLERHIESNKGRADAYVIDAAQYEVKKGQYSGKMFRVLLGDLTREPRVLAEDESVPKSLVDMVRNIPVEHKQAYENDIIEALRDISGIAAQPKQALIVNRDAVRELISKERKSPWIYTSEKGKIPNTINVSFAGKDQIADFLVFERLFGKDGRLPFRNNPRFLAIDTGYSGDAAGMALVCRGGVKVMERDGEKGAKERILIPKYWPDFYIRIKGRAREEFPLYKLTQFIRFLVDKCRINIRGLRTDGFQSVQLRQDVQLAYPSMDVDVLSVDRDDAAYLNLKNILYAGALDGMYRDENLLTELFDLLWITSATAPSNDNLRRMKVDHPAVASDGFVGRKDVADSLASALFTCKDLDRSLSEEEIAMQAAEFKSVNIDDITKKAEAEVEQAVKELDALKLGEI